MYTIKARIVEKPKATPQDILTLLPTQGPIGISIDMDEKFSLLEDNGIHIVQEPKEGMKRHALIIVGHGRTKDNQLFFIVQNTWGTSWCNNGYARIIIEKTCPIFYVEALLA
ncbi:cathepsin L-like [Brassica napus]|nr:cathepsin L-like [Brassica napus]